MDIRDAISELRDADARTAPAFEQLLARPRRARSVDYSVPRLALAASVVLAIGALATYSATRPKRLVVPAEVIALSNWQSPTASLLGTSTTSFYKATQNIDSTFNASVIRDP